MRLPESIETYGYFWVPDNPDNRLSGILRISETGKASLELFGSLRTPGSTPFDPPILQPTLILGVTAKKGAVTLVDCIVVKQGTTINVDVLSKSDVQVGWVFWGKHFASKDINLSAVSFSIEGLDEWFSLYYHPFSKGRTSRDDISISYTSPTPNPIAFQLPDDLTMSFHMRVGQSLSMFQQTLSTKMAVFLESGRMRSVSEFIELLRKIKSFLCLAFDRSVSFTAVAGYCNDPGDVPTPEDVIDIYSRLDAYDLQEQHFGPGQFLLQYQDVTDNIQAYVGKWLDGYEEYEPTFNLYFSVVANRYMHLEGRFLFLVQGIESLHRRSSSATHMPTEEFDNLLASLLENTPEERREWLSARLKYANELSLRSRIKEMMAPFTDLFGTAVDCQSFVNDVVNTRNYLTHYDDSIRVQAVTTPRELLELYYKLEGLVQLRLLALIGIEHEQIRKTVMQYPPLQRKLGIG